jgi:hypothetical protein
MSMNNQGFLFQGQLTTRLHTHKQTLHKAQRIWKQDTHQNQNMSSLDVIMYLQGYVRVMWDIAHCPFSKFISLWSNHKKNYRKDKAYQHWIVYVETFFCMLSLQLPQLHENKKPNGPCTWWNSELIQQQSNF